jgi:hypothetical protein
VWPDEPEKKSILDYSVNQNERELEPKPKPNPKPMSGKKEIEETKQRTENLDDVSLECDWSSLLSSALPFIRALDESLGLSFSFTIVSVGVIRVLVMSHRTEHQEIR